MQDIRYSLSPPENTKQSYPEYDTVDFRISAIGRKLVEGSITLLGDISVTDNNDLTETVAYDPFIGAHSFIDTLTTTFAKTGQVETLRFYPRYVSAESKAKLTKEDLFNSAYVCENRVPDSRMASNMLKGLVPYALQGGAFNAPETRKLDFAIKPKFCLNAPIGDNLLPYEKTGDILISMTIPRTVSVLFGNTDIGLDKKIELTNLRLAYTTVADDGKYSGKYVMRIRSDLKQTIQSTYSNISTKVPIVADSFFMSFIRQSEENQPLFNGLENQRLPNVSRVEFLWNDSFSQEFTYELDNEEEILTNYIKAINKTVGDNNANANALNSNDSYGIGLSFGQFLDLSKSKIGINIQSAVSSEEPYTAYAFFLGIVSV
jgi:hypothetical protein